MGFAFYWLLAIITLTLATGLGITLAHGDILISAIIGMSIIPIGLSFFLIQQRNFEWAAAYIALILIFLLTIVATLGLGIHHISNMAYVLILILSNLLVRRKTLILLTLVIIGCLGWLVFGEISGAYQHGVFTQSVPGDFFSASVIVLASTIVVYVLTSILIKNHQQLAQELKKKQRAEEQFRQLNVELGKRVEKRTDELENALAELEAFSYSISHDLRAPLRAVNGYAGMLLTEHGESLEPEVASKLIAIKGNGQMMGQLVDGLLEFLQTGRENVTCQDVEPAEIAQCVLNDFRPEIEQRKIQIVVGDLPPCYANSRLLYKVYNGLIGNAVKFTRNREPARIQIGAQQKDNRIVYFVRDNGVGFDMQYYDKLFGVFQRLHHLSEFDGIGASLAIVQRIIHRHGGNIWAEGEVDKGATFFFTLAKNHETIAQKEAGMGT